MNIENIGYVYGLTGSSFYAYISIGNYDCKPMDKYKESIKYLTKFSKTFSNKPHRLQIMNKKILRYGSSVESDF